MPVKACACRHLCSAPECRCGSCCDYCKHEPTAPPSVYLD